MIYRSSNMYFYFNQFSVQSCFTMYHYTSGIRCTNGQFFMPGKVLKTIYFLKGSYANNSNLILLGLEKQREITHET